MPNSSEQTQYLCLSDNARAILSRLLLILLVTVMGSIARNATAQETPFRPNWYMVLDRANLLDEGQETSAIDAAWRLSTSGLPTQVVTEISASTPELANQRAQQLLVSNQIESAPNADDGILVYAAVDPQDSTEVNIGIAVGPNVLPHGGLTDSDLETIRKEIVQVQLSDGHPARAIVYALREINYQDMFTPPPIVPLSGWRLSAGNLMIFVGPLMALLTIVAVFASLRRIGTFGGAVLPLTGGLVLALLLAAFAVMTRSGAGVMSAVIVLAAMVLMAMLVDRRIRTAGHREIRVTPRPPGLFGPAGRNQS